MASDATSRLPGWLHKVWHFTDDIRWMSPLPPAHRRGIIVAVLVILLAFLWPTSTSQYPVERPPLPGAEKEVPMQAEIIDNNAQQSASPAPQQPSPSEPQQQPPKADTQGEWRSFTVSAGQTLAQLFRDNNLPVGDVFAMAKVEGNGQPLSALQSGQQVKVRQNAHGEVTGLTVDSGNGPVLFTRQPDGTFIRAQ